MNILAVIAHPNYESFNHAVFKKAIQTLKNNGHSVFFHDLYAEKFDPVLKYDEIKTGKRAGIKLQVYIEELLESGGIVVVHPNWWGQPPAILTGWIDRVLKPGVAYAFAENDSGAGIPQGLLSGKKALVFNTSDTVEKREKTFFNDPLENIWRKCICEFCGITSFSRATFGPVVSSTLKQRQAWLDKVAEMTERAFG